jgi:flagellar basal-body rod protein FlgB
MAAVGGTLDFYRTVLDVRGYRQQLLTADIANASTPGFKAVDLDFKQALSSSLSEGDSATSNPSGPIWLVDDARQMTPAGIDDAESPSLRQAVKYQVGGDVSLDGNSVDLTQEKLFAADNAVQYEAAVTFTTQAVNMMMIAIKGSGGSSSSSSGA